VAVVVGQGTNTSLGTNKVSTVVCYTRDNTLVKTTHSTMVSNGWGTTYQEGNLQGVHCHLLSTRV